MTPYISQKRVSTVSEVFLRFQEKGSQKNYRIVKCLLVRTFQRTTGTREGMRKYMLITPWHLISGKEL